MPDNDYEEDYDSSPSNDEGFYKIPSHYELEETTDYTDFAGIEQRRLRNRKITLAVVSLITLLLIVGGTSFYLFQEHDKNSVQTKTNIAEPDKKATEVSETINPPIAEPEPAISKIFTDYPEVTPGEVKIINSDNGFQTTTNHTLLLTNGYKATAPLTTCSVMDPLDICFAGTVVKDDQNFNTYFMKDIVKSRFFDNANNVEKISGG